ncbi:toll/interleukin-1 receptor domain-containing protein [Halopseudomonas salegens]|uniref:TIR domain-containing protein n=1 Tax=Halopseudomonas salegens TaxID=1434072 RepID=A0A1H2EIC4_9GAMM|nr:toll/interleukin-1 receptor domain-containing protein [Halopseudomonas salegens]SDT94749.1 TIR domain-containing protein [Halopseudomonas salegens]
MNEYDFDIFISHASEDKDDFVRPLANALKNEGAKVWYDEMSLSVGDSLTRSIDKGLSKSRYGLVVISRSFVEKPWPEYEIRGLNAREIGSDKVVLPIWHNVSREEVLKFSPSLADKLALNSDLLSVKEICKQLLAIIRPDLLTKLQRKERYAQLKKNAKLEKVEPKLIKESGYKHKALPKDLLGRIRLIRASLWGVDTHSMDHWVDGFKRDSHPSNEIAWWEHVAAVYTEYVKSVAGDGKEQHSAIYKAIFLICNGEEPENVKGFVGFLTEDEFTLLIGECWSRAPLIDIEEQFEFKNTELDESTLELINKIGVEDFN